MTIKELTVPELTILILASNNMIAHYKGVIDKKILLQCPLCTVSYIASKEHDVSLETKDGYFIGKCICCPWLIIEGIECASLRFPVAPVCHLKTEGTYGVSDVRCHPETYVEQTEKAIERHERWLEVYQTELTRRNVCNFKT